MSQHTVIPGVSLVTLVNTIQEQFSSIVTVGEGFNDHAMQLKMASLAFDTWQKSSRVIQSTQETDETKTVRRLLQEMVDAFELARSMAERDYPPGASFALAQPSLRSTVSVRTRVRDFVHIHKRKATMKANRVQWIPRDVGSFARLVEKIENNVSQLTGSSPGLTHDVPIGLAQEQAEEALERSRRSRTMPPARAPASRTTGMLNNSNFDGHIYDGVTTRDQAIALEGHLHSSTQTGPFARTPRNHYGHSYAEDQSRIINGNCYGPEMLDVVLYGHRTPR